MPDESYQAFLASKAVKAVPRGMETAPPLAPHLFQFQSDCVRFGLEVGSSGLFLDTGLGKTECQLEWAKHVIAETGKPVLILTPLAVAQQTRRRAERWGYEAHVIRDASQAVPGAINICNYDRLDNLDPAAFGGAVLDEASILKSFTGKTSRALRDAFAGLRFKLAATATPAPNDHMELGQYSEFCEIMATNEMLSRYFINDTSTASQEWRLKAHAVNAFWDWMSSWARMATLPSDLGDYSDDGYILLPFRVVRHKARDVDIKAKDGALFASATMSATTMHDVNRQTSEARADAVARIVAQEPDEAWLLWCDTDYEADALKAAIPDAVEVRGSQPVETKEDRLEGFATGKYRVLIGKPSMIGFGLDWSHCARMAFVGRSYSYETWYQAVRRCWRFGQKRAVDVHLVVATGEDTIGRVLDRKATDHASMREAMRAAMRRANGKTAAVKVAYDPRNTTELAPWIVPSAA